MLGDLGTPLASSLGLSGSSNKVNDSKINRCLFEHTDGDALRIYGDRNTLENNLFQYQLDFSVNKKETIQDYDKIDIVDNKRLI